jgi:iron complex outermembrane receptor protein
MTPLLASLGAAAPLEEIEVRARRPQHTGDSALLAAPILPTDAPAPAGTIADLAQLQPGIAFAGQGGLLQTLSIRGLSGQQVANFWGEVPILGDRRAGTASSFIDPVMLGTMEILKGPATVFYGSGAGAGVLQFSPARPEGLEATLQWGANGDENLQYLGYGGESASLALSRRSADNGSTASGDRMHDRFDQYNGQLSWAGGFDGLQLRFNQLVSEGRDIGKSNNLYPDRVTDYPEESHWLGEFSASVGERLDASIYYHSQSLDTRVERVGDRINDVSSESFDWGFRAAWQLDALRAGLEYLGRRGVESEERETSLVTGDRFNSRPLDAEQDGIDLFLDGSTFFREVELAGGLRWSWIEQRAEDDIDDSALSGFVRAAIEPAPGLRLHLELSSGTRFASLGELFFSGTTARGQVLGNPDLAPEETLGLDFGVSWIGARSALDLRAFATRIDDYIERVDIAPGVRGFRNLTEGDIEGIEALAEFTLSDPLTLRIGGHYIDSEDDDGNQLQNVAAPEIFAAVAATWADWRGQARFGYRFSENDVAPGESPVDSAHVLTASLSRDWHKLELTVWGRNLLDHSYRLSSDELATAAPERSFGITLAWRERPR